MKKKVFVSIILVLSLFAPFCSAASVAIVSSNDIPVYAQAKDAFKKFVTAKGSFGSSKHSLT